MESLVLVKNLPAPLPDGKVVDQSPLVYTSTWVGVSTWTLTFLMFY